MKPLRKLTRRKFLKYTALAGGAMATGPYILHADIIGKLNVAVIGLSGRGAEHVHAYRYQNIVAICDIDSNHVESVGRTHPKAKRYRDYRVMFDKQKDIDAVSIAIPDNHHAPAAMRAIELGKCVYCEKPLTHNIYEARMLTLAAREHKVATQMGNQGHSGDGVRDFCEIIWSGLLGQIHEVHAWTNRPIWPQGMNKPIETPPVPKNIDWPQWVGPAPMRPYNPAYLPFKWRGWWDFGCGALGDMACHILDPFFWSLSPGYPTTCEAKSSGVNDQTAPDWSIIRWDFPARKNMSPVSLTWYDGGKKPDVPEAMGPDAKLGGNGSLFIGEKGVVVIGTYGGNPQIYPASLRQKYEAKKPRQILPRSPHEEVQQAHFDAFIAACKGGIPADSNFDYSGPMTEVVLLGNVALRVGKKLEWDGEGMRALNAPEAAQYVRRHYHNGWSL